MVSEMLGRNIVIAPPDQMEYNPMSSLPKPHSTLPIKSTIEYNFVLTLVPSNSIVLSPS